MTCTLAKQSVILKERPNNHTSYIRLMKSSAISLHFNDPGHSIKDLHVTPIVDISNFNNADRCNIETEFVSLLITTYPSDLNCYPIKE